MVGSAACTLESVSSGKSRRFCHLSALRPETARGDHAIGTTVRGGGAAPWELHRRARRSLPAGFLQPRGPGLGVSSGHPVCLAAETQSSGAGSATWGSVTRSPVSGPRPPGVLVSGLRSYSTLLFKCCHAVDSRGRASSHASAPQDAGPSRAARRGAPPGRHGRSPPTTPCTVVALPRGPAAWRLSPGQSHRAPRARAVAGGGRAAPRHPVGARPRPRGAGF